MDGRPREQDGGSRSRNVSERERERRLQRDGSASGSVVAVRGLEGASREVELWRVGECAATGRQREKERAVAVADASTVEKWRRTTSTSWAACCVPIECGRL